jgi:hypothetical protein
MCGFLIWTTSFRHGSQSLIILDSLLNVLYFSLLICLLLLSHIILMLQGFPIMIHLPLMLLLLFQFIQVVPVL